jgi:hypothetical protein
MRVSILTILAIVFISCTKACAGTEVHFYGAYTNKADSVIYHDYDLLNYKRGLFLGICPTTKQLQWAYWFRLAGERSTYSPNQFTVQDDISSVGTTKVYLKVVSGSVVLDRSSQTMTVDIQVEQAGSTNQFIGNGTYSFHK